jgi:SAM-dependent methyltransferase
MTPSLHTLPSRLRDLLCDAYLGIETRGRVGLRTEEISHYSTISYRLVGSILDRLALREGDVFVDLGCGKGRAICVAARRGIDAAVGVDLSKELCEIARANARRLRGRCARIEIVEREAQRFDFDRGTAFYLFDPFGPETMREVVARVAESARRVPRDLRIAYANPRCEDVFRACAALVEYDRWPAKERRIEHTVAFYRLAPPA